MSIDGYVSGNDRYVATFDGEGLPIRPRTGMIIVSCVDARVDPAAIFDLDLGDAFILRSVGGRVTPDILAQIGMVRALVSSMPDAGPPDVLVMHHTECGTVRFSDDALRARAAELAHVDETEVRAVIVEDASVSVAEDKALLEATQPEGTRVHGFVYDIRTGRATQV